MVVGGFVLALVPALVACEGNRDAAQEVASSCRAIEGALRHRAQSFEDEPGLLLSSVLIEGHGTTPQLRHVALCVRVQEPTEGAFDALMTEYTGAVDEAHGLSTRPDPLPPAEEARRWRELLTRMADIMHRINAGEGAGEE